MPLRLIKMKLAGFKSFVDPTTVKFPSNRVAVVGPNGCGKSNIVDAVRWVMGESSAKYLRSESMASVIFNGSSTRKPVGQASIELFFDNTDGSAGGEYSKYSEIAIKRVVSRDGSSNYFLNSTRCRRKDITDLFLGTGLGPRSYAIIEQGTISRLVEAKPDEMRVTLEEAAGISKYKERRRETENRIKHTRENLSRIEDLREEINKQLERLNRQAKAAERYKVLREEESNLQAQLQAIKWHNLYKELVQQEEYISQQDLQFQSYITEQHRYDKEIIITRESHTESNDQFNQIQQQFYQLGAQIARVEEAIEQQQQRKTQLEADLQLSRADLAKAETLFEQDQSQISKRQQQVAQLTPQLSDVQNQQIHYVEHYQTVQQEMDDWQQQWNEFIEQSAHRGQQAQVEQTRIQHFEQEINQLRQRSEKLRQEQLQLDTQPIEQQLQSLDTELSSIEDEQQRAESQLQEIRQKIQSGREHQQVLRDDLDDEKSKRRQLQGRYASLQALQQAALGGQDDNTQQWLENQSLADKPRLAECLKVDAFWQAAVETVLGDYLQAVCLENLNQPINLLNDMTDINLNFVLQAELTTTSLEPRHRLTPLINYAQSPSLAVTHLLQSIYCVDDLTQASSLLNELKPHESLITADGIWLSQHWLRVTKKAKQESGVLKRQNEMQQCQSDAAIVSDSIERLENQLLQAKEQLSADEEYAVEQQQTANKFNSQLSEKKALLQVQLNQKQQLEKRAATITQELTELETQNQQRQTQLQTTRESWQQAMADMSDDATSKDGLQASKESIEQQLDQAREQNQSVNQQAHELELTLGTAKSELNNLEQNIHRNNENITQLRARCQQLDVQLNAIFNPQNELSSQLNDHLEQRLQLEQALNAARSKAEHYQTELDQLAKKHQSADNQAKKIQSELSQKRLDAQSIRVRCSTIEEAMVENNRQLTEVMNSLDESANEKEWQENLATITRKIQNLGAINLAAIDEFKTESERKVYLDTQYDDLVSALNTLESAIQKIDQETRVRFKETFEQVNEKFSSLFPSLFGGGKAYLELSENDLLNTGVAIMARPPGKRNSSIHALSGGEKAMTAIALVFAIFHLNPAPFCMLDEVDAPLDDANVARFCRLVKEMSNTLQFIFITHNKVTMELADHLSGVTMSEPGCSRIVSVDVEEAASFASV